MKKRMIIIGILFIFIFCLLAGCQKTPDEVLHRMEQYGDNSTGEQENVQYCKPSELAQSQTAVLQMQTDNLILPQEIHLGEWDGIYELSLQYKSDFSKVKDSIANLFAGQQISWEYEANAESTMKDDDFYFYDNDKDFYLSLSDNGFVSMNCNKIYDLLHLSGNEDVGYTVLDETTLNGAKQVVFKGEEQSSVQEEIAYVEQWMGDNWISYEPEYVYKVKDALLYDDSEQEILSMNLQPYYQGVPFTINGLTLSEDDDVTYCSRTESGITVALSGKQKIEYFSNGIGSLTVCDSVAVEKVIDLESAIKLVEQKLSGFKKYNIKDIVVQYDMFPNYRYKVEKGEKKGNPSGYGVNVYTRPVYSFVLSKVVEEDGGFYINESDLYGYVDVDMIDGTIYCDLQNVSYGGENYGTKNSD
jgi:hypothetical protein